MGMGLWWRERGSEGDREEKRRRKRVGSALIGFLRKNQPIGVRKEGKGPPSGRRV